LQKNDTLKLTILGKCRSSSEKVRLEFVRSIGG